MIAYSGTCGSLTSIGCADTSFGGGIEVVRLTGLTASETYLFRVYGYGSSATSRSNFTINMAGSALPVFITNFFGEKKGNTNLISWTTATEQSNKGFELQKSFNGENFSLLNFVETKAINGNSSSILNYQFNDTKPFAGTTYYRLKQMDKNGKSTLSNIIAIKGEKITTLTVSDVYPNPTANLLNLIVSSPTNETASIVVTDITGKLVKTMQTQIISGNSSVKLNVSNLSKGTYILKVLCKNGCNSAAVKFVKD